MNVWDTSERKLLARTVADFTERELVPNLPEWEAQGLVPREVHKKAAELGLLEIGFPASAGGSGDIIDTLTVAEAILGAGGSTGLCAALFTHGIALPHIVRAGDPSQMERYVRPTLAGEKIGSLAITEPDAGSDVASIATTARLEGDHYLVNGSKTYITSGFRADFVVAAVRTGGPGSRGVSLLIIDKDTPGFTVTRKLDKMGWLCSDTAELSFVDVTVPAGNLVGEEGTGFRQIMENFETERLTMAAQAAASARRCLALTMEWVSTRESFGSKLSSHQVVRHKVAEMARQVAVATTFVHQVVEDYAAGASDRARIAMAKNTAVYALDFVSQEAVQLHGGAGFMRGTEVERHYRDARVMGIGGGTNEIMNEIIARMLGL
ncbi:MAG: acyl-CoA dehydrogenase family protein [Actinomycetota bacterium]|nr:acyl-CoA dehydrogenase family protein [Actinomycetota bacterium]